LGAGQVRKQGDPSAIFIVSDFSVIVNKIIPSPFDLSTGLSHTHLSQKHAKIRGSRQGYLVHIYENKIEILNSPFSSYSAGHKAIGLKANSRIIASYIDTGKVYNGKYTFTSSFT